VGYDVAAIRKQFPALAEGAAHFDGPGGSQVPAVVGDAVAATLTAAISNRGRSTPAERRADDTVRAARLAIADLLGGDPRGVVFGRSMTQLTYDFSRTVAKGWSAGDEVVVSRLDHDANIRPWLQAAGAVGATVRSIDFDRQTTELTPADVARVVSSRTRLVAVTAGSNLLGTRPDMAQIAALVHDAGALLYVDGSISPRTRRSTWPRWAPTSTCARRTSFLARIAACSPPRRSCSRRYILTSCSPRPTMCLSDSNWGRCPTSC